MHLQGCQRLQINEAVRGCESECVEAETSNADVTQDSDLLICPEEPLCWTVITAIIHWANVISVTSDVLQIPTQSVMLFSAAFWIHSGHIQRLSVSSGSFEELWSLRISLNIIGSDRHPATHHPFLSVGPFPRTHRRTGRGPAMAEILALPVYCFKTQQGAEKQWAQPAFSFFLFFSADVKQMFYG